MSTIRKIDLCFQGIICMLCLGAALIGYWRIPFLMVELTFMSNLLTGLLYGAGFALAWMGRRLSPMLSFCCTIVLLMVCLVSLAFAGEMNFSGAFFFLHILNPLFVLLHWLLFCDHNKSKRGMALCALLFPAAYFTFAFFFGRATGEYLYPFLNADANGVPFVLLFAAVTGVSLAVLSFALFFFNRWLHRKAPRLAG